MSLKLDFKKKNFHLKDNFKISRGTKSKIKTIIIKLYNNNASGFGECIPYKRYNETFKKIWKYLQNNKENIEKNLIKKVPYLSLQNALENANSHLNRKKRIKLFKNHFLTSVTIAIDNKNKIIKKLKKLRNINYIKVKLNSSNVIKTLNLIKIYSPKSKIIIDTNEGWSFNFLNKTLPKLEQYNVYMIEQPLREGRDNLLRKIKTKILFCADESFRGGNLNKIKSIYDCFNIKLDKFGGVSNCKKIIKKIKKLKKKIMIGCMVSSSLSIIPAIQLIKKADLIDLDGAFYLKKDFKFSLKYKKDIVKINKKFFWMNRTGPEENLQGLF